MTPRETLKLQHAGHVYEVVRFSDEKEAGTFLRFWRVCKDGSRGAQLHSTHKVAQELRRIVSTGDRQ